MPSVPLVGGSYGEGQAFATSTYGTTLTASATGNVKGTVVELIAATAHDAHWVEVMATGPSAAGTFAFDVLTGASTEAVLIPNLTFFARGATDGGGRWLFPLYVPKGSRLAARVASTIGGASMLVGVGLFNAGLAANAFGGTVDQYGTINASAGVNVDPGAVANTDVTVQITAATVRPHHWLVLTVLNVDVAYAAAVKKLVDLCVGAATEQAILEDWPIGGGGTQDCHRPDNCIHIPAFVPQGSRLTVRARCSSTTDGDRDLYCTIHGC